MYNSRTFSKPKHRPTPKSKSVKKYSITKTKELAQQDRKHALFLEQQRRRQREEELARQRIQEIERQQAERQEAERQEELTRLAKQKEKESQRHDALTKKFTFPLKKSEGGKKTKHYRSR
jgi:hypothetical protein